MELGGDAADIDREDTIQIIGESCAGRDDGWGQLTSTANVENDVVRLGVEPLHDLGCQLGDERSGVLVSLVIPSA